MAARKRARSVAACPSGAWLSGNPWSMGVWKSLEHGCLEILGKSQEHGCLLYMSGVRPSACDAGWRGSNDREDGVLNGRESGGI